MRRYLRAIARANMEREGIQHINKTRHVINHITGRPTILPSFFAENWRKYI